MPEINNTIALTNHTHNENKQPDECMIKNYMFDNHILNNYVSQISNAEQNMNTIFKK